MLDVCGFEGVLGSVGIIVHKQQVEDWLEVPETYQIDVIIWWVMSIWRVTTLINEGKWQRI